MLKVEDGTTEIALKLTARGRYVWTITASFPTKEREEAVERLRATDKLLKDAFPNYVIQGSGRVATFEED